jgi:hypothetical protein
MIETAAAVAAVAAVAADIWDTAGQERFNSMHASYYYRAHVSSHHTMHGYFLQRLSSAAAVKQLEAE